MEVGRRSNQLQEISYPPSRALKMTCSCFVFKFSRFKKRRRRNCKFTQSIKMFARRRETFHGETRVSSDCCALESEGSPKSTSPSRLPLLYFATILMPIILPFVISSQLVALADCQLILSHPKSYRDLNRINLNSPIPLAKTSTLPDNPHKIPSNEKSSSSKLPDQDWKMGKLYTSENIANYSTMPTNIEKQNELLRKLSSTMLLGSLLRHPLPNRKLPLSSLVPPPIRDELAYGSRRKAHRHPDRPGDSINLIRLRKNASSQMNQSRATNSEDDEALKSLDNGERNQFPVITSLNKNSSSLSLFNVASLNYLVDELLNMKHPKKVSTSYQKRPANRGRHPIISDDEKNTGVTLDMLIKDEYDSRVRPMVKSLVEQQELSKNQSLHETDHLVVGNTTDLIPLNHRHDQFTSSSKQEAILNSSSYKIQDRNIHPEVPTTTPMSSETIVTIDPSDKNTLIAFEDTGDDDGDDEESSTDEGSTPSIPMSRTVNITSPLRTLQNVPPYQLSSDFDPHFMRLRPSKSGSTTSTIPPYTTTARLKSRNGPEIRGRDEYRFGEKVMDASVRGSLVFSDGDDETERANRKRAQSLLKGGSAKKNHIKPDRGRVQMNSPDMITDRTLFNDDKSGDSYLLRQLLSTVNPLTELDLKLKEQGMVRKDPVPKNPLTYKGYVGRDDFMYNPHNGDWSRPISSLHDSVITKYSIPDRRDPSSTTTTTPAPVTDSPYVPYNYFLNQPVTNAQSVPSIIIPASERPEVKSPPPMPTQNSSFIPMNNTQDSDSNRGYTSINHDTNMNKISSNDEDLNEGAPNRTKNDIKSSKNETKHPADINGSWSPGNSPDVTKPFSKQTQPPYPRETDRQSQPKLGASTNGTKFSESIRKSMNDDQNRNNNPRESENANTDKNEQVRESMIRESPIKKFANHDKTDTAKEAPTANRGSKRNRTKVHPSGVHDYTADSSDIKGTMGESGRPSSGSKILKGGESTRKLSNEDSEVDNREDQDESEGDDEAHEPEIEQQSRKLPKMGRNKTEDISGFSDESIEVTDDRRIHKNNKNIRKGSTGANTESNGSSSSTTKEVTGSKVANRNRHSSKSDDTPSDNWAADGETKLGGSTTGILHPSSSIGSTLIPNINYLNQATSESPSLDHSPPQMNGAMTSAGANPSRGNKYMTSIEPYQRSSNNVMLSIQQPGSSTISPPSTPKMTTPMLTSATESTPKQEEPNNSGPDHPAKAGKSSNDRLAFILIGGSCALSVVCLILAAMSIRCEDMCDDYRSLRNAERAALKLQKHRIKYTKSHQINRLNHSVSTPDLAQDLSDNTNFQTGNNNINNNSIDVEINQPRSHRQYMNGKSIQFNNDPFSKGHDVDFNGFSSSTNCKALPLNAYKDAFGCRCGNCGNHRWLSQDDMLIAGNRKQHQSWLQSYYHMQNQARLRPLFGAGSSVETFFPRRVDDQNFLNGHSDAQVLLDNRSCSGPGVARSKSIRLKAKMVAPRCKSEHLEQNFDCNNPEHSHHVCHNYRKYSAESSSDDGKFSFDESGLCDGLICTASHQHNCVDLNRRPKLMQMKSSLYNWKTDQGQNSIPSHNHHHGHHHHHHHHQPQQAASSSDSSSAQCTCSRDHQPLISKTTRGQGRSHKRPHKREPTHSERHQAKCDKSMFIWSTNRDRLI